MPSSLPSRWPWCDSRPVWAGACWLLLPLLALWPVWLWTARRLGDGSDDPLGLVALLWLLGVLWRARLGLKASPHLGWLGLALGLGDRAFARRLPLLGVIVLVGNILRNTLLVLLESGWFSGPAWAHEAIGLLVFAGVCTLVLLYMAATAPEATALRRTPEPSGEPAPRRATVGLRTALALGFIGLGLLPALHAPATAVAPATYVEWPREFAGRTLRPLALSAVEQRFAEQFPGAIARFTDGQQQLSLRHVTAATRKLHPAADCYRGLGYRIRAIALERRPGDALQGLQRCFVAERQGARVRVCEYIEDAQARTFSDTSAWYWAALSGQSEGPWRAVTLARPF